MTIIANTLKQRLCIQCNALLCCDSPELRWKGCRQIFQSNSSFRRDADENISVLELFSLVGEAESLKAERKSF